MTTVIDILNEISQLKDDTRNRIVNLNYAINEEGCEDRIPELLDLMSIRQIMDGLDNSFFEYVSLNRGEENYEN